MKIKLMLHIILIVIFFAGFSFKSNDRNRIQPWLENPWFWQYKNEPVLLLGASSDDNLFQWPAEILILHLDSMKDIGANYVRNTMSDRQDKGFELYPFFLLDNGKYDLEQLNEKYFERFEFFLRETKKRDIIVQIEIWDRFDYSRENWPSQPYNPKNNVNYSEEESGFALEYPDHPAQNKQPFFFSTPKQKNNEVLMKYQKMFVEKMFSISSEFNHVLYCMDNETAAEEEWAIFWAELILTKAKEAGISVCVTEMWDNWDLKSKEHKRTFDHPERYSFCDVSQNNQKKGQEHWDNFQWVRNYISSNRRPLNTVKTYGSDGGRHGNSQDGLERWWQHVLGGVASARFHRPTSGFGLSELSINSIKIARQIESVVRFWDLKPGNHLLLDREENEAYLAFKEGEKYLLYFPGGGEIKLDLTSYDFQFQQIWMNINTGEIQDEKTVGGGKQLHIKIQGSENWITLISKRKD
ncbi:MAG: hypothetical protein HQ541_10970 [Mariniphaga sp.]|nr:hypothetical protein [Mariniphaga sp.]